MKRGKDLDVTRIRRAFRVRLDPTIEQARELARYAGGARVAYNWALAEWRQQWRAKKLADRAPDRALALLTRWGSPLATDPRWTWRERMPEYERAKAAGEATAHPNPAPNAYAIHARLTAAKRGEIVIPPRARGRVPGPWIGSIPSLVLREAVADVGAAYEHFFRRLKEGAVGREAGEPRFRAYDDEHARFHVDQGTALQVRADAVKLPVLGWIRVQKKQRGYVPTDAKICGIGISRHLGCWYAAIRVETDAPKHVPNRARKVAGKKLGVEVGVRALAVFSDGRAILDRRGVRPLTDKARASIESHERRMGAAMRKLALWQRRMARRHKSGVATREQSRGWHEAKHHVQRLYAIITRIRDELLHYASRRAVDSGAARIVMREPAVKRMIGRAGKKNEAMGVRNALAPMVSQIGWYELRRKVEYKQAWMMAVHRQPAEGSFVEAPAEHKTSRICSVCGVARETQADYPSFVCTDPACGHREDRDDNAAKVLRDFAPSSDGGKDGARTARRKTARKGGTTVSGSGTRGAEQSTVTGPHGDETSPLGPDNGTAHKAGTGAVIRDPTRTDGEPSASINVHEACERRSADRPAIERSRGLASPADGPSGDRSQDESQMRESTR